MADVHLFASWPHYFDHLWPVWSNLPDRLRGQVVTSSEQVRVQARRYGVTVRSPRRFRSEDVVLVAGYNDVRRVHGARLVLLDHGVGQTYVGVENGSYAGAPGRHRVGLFLHPHERVMDLEAATYPKAEHRVVGCPKLDVLWRMVSGWPVPEPTAAVSFHWRCRVAPEAGTAFDDWRDEVARLRESGWRVVGHGHPRMWNELAPYWRQVGAMLEPGFGRAVQQCSVYVCDNSSTLFEAAAVGCPVVMLSGSGWRRDVRHGLRFGEAHGLGPDLHPGESLPYGLGVALTWPKAKRAEVLERVYRFLPDGSGAATTAAVEAVCEWVG